MACQRFSWVYWSVASSSWGVAYSSGIRNRLSSLARRPRCTRLEITDTGIDSISEPTIGTSHHRKLGFSQATSNAQATPSRVCGP
ncbi:hypothetical protein D3C77_586670 [compost metagenome]